MAASVAFRFRSFCSLRNCFFVYEKAGFRINTLWIRIQTSNFLNSGSGSRLHTYDGVSRVSGLRRKPVVSVKNPTLIPTYHWKIWSRASSVHRTPAQNSQREGRSLPRQDRDHLSQWDARISVGISRRLQVPYVIQRPGVPGHILQLLRTIIKVHILFFWPLYSEANKLIMYTDRKVCIFWWKLIDNNFPYYFLLPNQNTMKILCFRISRENLYSAFTQSPIWIWITSNDLLQPYLHHPHPHVLMLIQRQ